MMKPQDRHFTFFILNSGFYIFNLEFLRTYGAISQTLLP